MNKVKSIFRTFLALVVMLTTVLLGCSSALQNPYKGRGVVIAISAADLINRADTPLGTLGDEDHFVVRVALDAYNIDIPANDGSEQNAKKRIMALFTSSVCCIEAGDRTELCQASDASKLQYSQRTSVIKGAVLYYAVPVQYINAPLRFVVYDTADTRTRNVLFETENFNKSRFDQTQYEAQATSSVQQTMEPQVGQLPDRIERVRYEGLVETPFAKKLFVRCMLSDDLSRVLSMEIQIENMEVEVKSDFKDIVYTVEKQTTAGELNQQIQDGKVAFDFGDFELNLGVLDSCLYGRVHCLFVPPQSGDNPSARPVPIDLGTYDVILTNQTDPKPLPENMMELFGSLQKFQTEK